ncbi:MAG: hypothetical protein KGK30_02260, partial [Elusimicrobia bacterium]|nr:hypothetical protein [Elusimicrobiota bacterium]
MTAEVLLEPGASKPVASVHRGAPGGLEVVIGWRSGRPISMALRASPAALLAELGRRGIKAPAALRRWRRERRVELLRQAGRWSPARYRLLPDAAALRRDGGLRPLVCDLEQLSPLRSIWAREPWPG